MAIITQTAAGGGTQFAYTTTFANTGSDRVKVLIGTVCFTTAGAITSWALTLEDEGGATRATVLSGTTTTFYSDNIGPLPVTAAGESYQLTFTTVGMVGAGTLTIDHQAILTGAT